MRAFNPRCITQFTLQLLVCGVTDERFKYVDYLPLAEIGVVQTVLIVFSVSCALVCKLNS